MNKRTDYITKNNLLIRAAKYFMKDIFVPLLIGVIIFYTTIYLIGNPLDTPRPPDLEIIDVDPLHFNPGDDIILKVKFQNNGEKPANDLLIKARPDSMWDSTGYQIGANYNKTLKGNFEQTTASFIFQVPSNFTEHPSWTINVITNTPFKQTWDCNITYVYKPIYNEYRLVS